MTSRRAVKGLALLAFVSLGIVAEAAGKPTSDDVTVVVLLSEATRWDAWHGAMAADGSGAPVEAAAAGQRARAARRAALASGMAVARAALPVERLATQRGGRIIARYDTALAGLLVRLPRDELPSIAALPTVARIVPAPRVSLDLRDSVSGIGADRVREELGVSGNLATIAIVDTGVDYTHAAFGGPGTPEAYAAAAAAAETIDDTWQGRALFPTERVVAGHDFAGPKYSPICTPQLEAQGACTIAPRPDPDPLDTIGHGTTVADVAAGSGTSALGPGVAPGARLVALKIFGNSNLTNLLIDPIEWAIEANMGEAGRPHIDVMNMSLGQPYGAGLDIQEEAVRRAVEAGIVVIASAGNHGAVPFIASAPGVASDALAVASYVPPGRHGWSASLVPADGAPLAFDGAALYLQGWSPDPRAAITAPVVHVGRACPRGPGGGPGDPVPDLPAGAIALFDMAWGSAGPECTVDVQARRLQDEGAAAALMGAGIGLPVAAAWDAQPTVDIPVWMVNHDLETAIEEIAAPGMSATLTITPVPLPGADRVMSSFSSLGPGRNGALKPDLAGPRQGVIAAALGQGHRGAARTGTSIAAPHASGAAALVWHRARQLGWTVTARDVSAALITTANPGTLRTSAARPGIASASRAGQGELDAWAAVTSETLVRAGPAASISLGMHALEEPISWSRAVTITNRSDSRRAYDVIARYRTESDQGAGLTVRVAPPEVVLEPGMSVGVAVTFDMDPARLPPWRLGSGDRTGDADALDAAMLDGWIEVAEPNSSDVVVPLGVPFSVLARRASAIAARWPATEVDTAAPHLALRNAGPFAGTAEVYLLGATDAIEPGLPGSADLDAVGVRAWPDGQGNTVLEFALHSRAPHAHPLESVSEVQIDTDEDGVAEYLVYTIDEATLATGDERNGRVTVALQPPEGSPFGSPVARFFAGGGIHSRWITLPVLAEDAGLTPSRLAFRYRVTRRSTVERLPEGAAAIDMVPSHGGWLPFDGRTALPWPVAPGANVGGDADVIVPLPRECLDPPGLVARLPDNAPGPDDISLQRPDAPPVTGIFLPALRQRRALHADPPVERR